MEESPQSRAEFLRHIKAALELLLQDCELVEDGFQFFDVVDFAAIYAYVYKQSSPPFIRLSGEPEERTFARRQLALQRLFSNDEGRRPLLLIPPYQAELSNHIKSVYSIVGLGSLDVRVLYREKLSRLVEQSGPFKEFLKLRSSGAPAQKQLQQAALQVAKDYFPELYASLAFLRDGSPQALLALTRNKVVLRLADELVPECREIDYSAKSTMRWYSKININRNGKRALQSHTDAMACTYLEVANARLNSAKKAVVFVSPSANVSAALSESLFISAGSHLKIPVVRDLTYCMLSSLHKLDKGMINKATVKENLTMVGRLLELYDSEIKVEGDLEKRREEAAQDWRRCQNLVMATETTNIEPDKRMGTRDQDFLKVLQELERAATSGDSVQTEIATKLSALQQEVGELNKLIPAISVEKAKSMYESIKVNRGIQTERRGFRIVFPGFSDELPLELTFTDRSMIHLADAFKRLKQDNFPDTEILSVRKEVLDSAGGKDTGPEHHLLAGYFLALEGRYSAALSELGTGTLKANQHQKVELDLVSAMVHRKIGHAKEAVRLLRRALGMAPEEARIHVEIARALTMMWRQRTDDRNGTRDLDRALDHLQQAIKFAGDRLSREARTQIENVAAFVCTEKAFAERTEAGSFLETARSHIRQMEELLPQEAWIGRFLDTRGYWQYACAELLEKDPAEKLTMLYAAEQDLERALQCNENFLVGPNIRQEHLEHVRKAISKFEVARPVAEPSAPVGA